MFHMTMIEAVAREQRSDRLKKAEIARLLKETRLNNSKGEARYLEGIRNFVNTLRSTSEERITTNKVGLLTQKC